MSYILDALKKSDQERQRGAVPNLHTVQVPLSRESQRRSRWYLILALALLLNGGLLVWWLRPWQVGPPESGGRPAADQQFAGKDQGVARDPADADSSASPSHSGTTKERRQGNQGSPRQSSAVPPPPSAASTPKPAGAARATRQEPAKAETVAKEANRMVPREDAKGGQENPLAKPRIAQGAGHPAGEPTQKAGSAKQKTEARQNPPNEHKSDSQERTITRLTVPPDIKDPPGGPGIAAKQEFPTSRPGPSEQPISPGTQALADPGVPKLSPEAKPSAEPGQPKAPSRSQPSVEQGLPDARELPLSIQRELPRMSVSMVIYSDKPGDRMININGRMMREGQEVSPGLKVEQITPTGAILKFQGHRFRKGVL